MISVRGIVTLLALLLLSACEHRSSPTKPFEPAKSEPHSGPLFNEAFVDGFSVSVGETTYRFRTQHIGEIRLTSGKLVACDPIVDCGTPFADQFPVGTFPLDLAIATIGEDERIGLAKIIFAPGRIVSWELAVTDQQDRSTLKPGELFGYGVDSGKGGFMDVAALHAYEAERNREGEQFDKHLFAALDKTYRHTRSWHLYQTNKGTVALFSSGYGDGFYATYKGYDKTGRLVAVVTDFLIVPWQ